MRKTSIKLNIFDLLDWVNDDEFGIANEQKYSVRNLLNKTILSQFDLSLDGFDYEISELMDIDYSHLLQTSAQKKPKVVNTLYKLGLDSSFLYSALSSPESHSIISARTVFERISDSGDPYFKTISRIVTIGSSAPVVMTLDGMDVNIDIIIDCNINDWTNQNNYALGYCAEQIIQEVSGQTIGGIRLPADVSEINFSLYALGGMFDGNRDLALINESKIVNVALNHPVLRQLHTAGLWRLISDDDFRGFEQAIINMVNASKGFNTDEVSKIIGMLFSKHEEAVFLAS